MNAGRLRHRVVFEVRGSTPDDYGEPVETWTTAFTDWAQVQQLRGREFFSDARISADVDTRVIMRYRAGVTKRHRINFEGRILDIEYILEDERRTSLELLCKEAGA